MKQEFELFSKNEKRPELIIHIGSHKTGSTSLQWAFIKNRKLLRQERIFYPTGSRGFLYGRELNYFMTRKIIAKSLSFDQNRQNYFELKLKDLINITLKEFRKSDCNKMLISEEGLSSFPYDTLFESELEEIGTFHLCVTMYESLYNKVLRLKQLFKDFDIKIVYYLRRQDLFIESFYNHIVKRGTAYNIVNIQKINHYLCAYNNSYEFISNYNNHKFDLFYQLYFKNTYYYDKLDIWAKVFGKENIIVKPFEKSQFKEGLVKDFFTSVLNIEPNQLTDLQEERTNESVSRDVLEYLEELNRKPKYYEPIDLVEISKKLGDVKRYQEYFTREERLRLLEHHREGNERIAREYLGREDGKLFYEEVTTKESEPYPGLTDEKRALLNQEFRKLDRVRLAHKVRQMIFEIKSNAQISTSNNNQFIKELKAYSLTLLIILQKICRSVKRRVLKRPV